jgi:basic membrane protein A
MLTSMVKRVDVAVYNLARQTRPGVTVLGLKEGGVDYALDQYNDKLLTPDMRRRVEDAKAQIIAGKIKVVDFMAANRCKP